MTTSHEFINSPEAYILRPPIVENDLVYEWFTNSQLPTEELKNLADTGDSYGRYRFNWSSYYVDLYSGFVQRGLGIIPNVPACKNNGTTDPTSFAFYRRSEITDEEFFDFINAIQASFPKGILPESDNPQPDQLPLRDTDINQMIDRTLQQIHFAKLLVKISPHLELN